MTNGSIVGIDAANGASLWSIPFQDEWHENIVSPLWTGNALIVSGPRQGTHAYAIARAGGTWQAKQLWKNADVTMYTVAPVLADGIIYGMSNKRRGQFVAVRAIRWLAQMVDHGPRRQPRVDPAARRAPLFLTDGGVLIVARRGPRRDSPKRRRYETRATSPTWSVPVFLPDGMLVRDANSVQRLTWEP